MNIIKCTIERGGFASERSFMIHDACGDAHEALSDTSHLLTGNKKPLMENEQDIVYGYVKCIPLRFTEGGVLCDFPGGLIAVIPQNRLEEFP